ncbi:MAG: hypothetical protein IJW69_01260, partial [Clostridia bacterium]|nr:hypothetical protein [Clostridia bacterium]
LKKDPQKLLPHGYLQNSRHFVDRKSKIFCQRKAHTPTNRARSLFGDVAFARHCSSRAREEHKMTRKTSTIKFLQTL